LLRGALSKNTAEEGLTNMTLFYLIRHGKKETAKGDVPLSPQGLREAQATAHALRKVPISQIYASPLLRAKETAALIAASCGLAVIEEGRLRERANWGDLPGQSFAEFVEMWERSTSDPTFVPPVGDSARQAGMRMDQVLREVSQRAPTAQMVMVTHGGLITDFLVTILPVEQLQRWHPDFLAVQSRLIPECSITVVRVEQGRTTLEQLAQVEHLLALLPGSPSPGQPETEGKRKEHLPDSSERR
jgi:2,3-bisphosphoglycerate-dependent phosphoglycerate mutase